MSIRVLVVEDEANIADFLLRGLREEGYAVEHAADGTTAWHALRTGEWDLVLLDWWLPDQDGLTLLQRFRQVGRRTPVLFLTARDAVSDRVRGPGRRGRRLPGKAVCLRRAAGARSRSGAPAGSSGQHDDFLSRRAG